MSAMMATSSDNEMKMMPQLNLNSGQYLVMPESMSFVLTR